MIRIEKLELNQVLNVELLFDNDKFSSCDIICNNKRIIGFTNNALVFYKSPVIDFINIII